MNFILGAMIIDCIANSNEEKSENGVGLLVSIALLIYIIYKLPTIEQYTLNIAMKDVNLLCVLVIGFSILIPIYMVHSINNKSILIGFMLRVMIYIDVFSGIGLMVYFSNILGSNPASFLFDISKVAFYGQSKSFFTSLFASIAYLIIKFLDYVSIIGLIPFFQVVLASLVKKIIKIDNK